MLRDEVWVFLQRGMKRKVLFQRGDRMRGHYEGWVWQSERFEQFSWLKSNRNGKI